MIRMTRLFPWLVVLTLAGCGGAREGDLPKVRDHPNVEAPRVVIEAEDATSLEPPVVADDDKDASGGRCIIVPGGSGKPDEEIPGEPGKKRPSRWGAAVYRFSVPEAGPYRIWGRKFWEDGCGNSFTFVVNGGPPVEFGGDSTYNVWDWRAAPVLFDLRAGENTLEVLNREDGVRLDRLIITRDPDFIPQGKE